MAKLATVTDGAPPRSEPEECGLRDLDDDDQKKERDAAGGERLELAVAVGMIRVGRLLREPQSDERDDVRRAVGERVKTVGEDADGAAQLAEARSSPARRRGSGRGCERGLADFACRDSVALEIASIVNLPICQSRVRIQNSRAVGIGHQRTCTLPMM